MQQPIHKRIVYQRALPDLFKNLQTEGATLQFVAMPEEFSTARQIAQRAVDNAAARGVRLDFQQVYIDIMTCHCNGTRLSLLQLLMSDGTDFEADVSGIGLCLDRVSGKLLNGFVPRFAEKI